MNFTSPEHEHLFHERGASYRLGGPNVRVCGARLKTGASCPNPAIKESKQGRCLSHCGPHAARAYRERQKRRFEAGSVSAEEWNQAEARRAANRLGDQWKKNPWLPGSTIDLGEHEYAFRGTLGEFDVEALPPAVADWLRWRYRRTQIDRQNGSAWHKALTQDLPRRVAEVGPRPVSSCGRGPTSMATPRTWKVESVEQRGCSKRTLPDKPRATRFKPITGCGRRGRPRTQPANEDELTVLARVYRENAEVLEPIMAGLSGDAKQLAALRTLHDYLARPDDAEACKRWLALVAAART